ncbi:MAG TPA: nucleotidyltransferase domain-containing protein [Candidatus Atribacteria bacterium]|nr:nucleotidyltransferase domain-containing protein [Candidatus Atribacteria bacterium]
MFDKFNVINIKKIFSDENDILLAYIFGSQLKSKISPLSDYDFAVFLSQEPSFQFKYKLKNKLVNFLNTGQVDLVILNNAPIELKYNIIATGKNIFQKNSTIRTEFEADTLSKYFDYLPILRTQKKEILKFKPKGEKYGDRIQRYRASLGKTEEMLDKIRTS